MAEKNNDTRNYVIIAVIILIIILLILFWDKVKGVFSKKTAEIPPSQQNGSGSDGGSAPSGLNPDKVLKRGVNGNEVKLLQQWLGVDQDGIFGPITEAALLQLKGVNQITLREFPDTPDMNFNPGFFDQQHFMELSMPADDGALNTVITNTISYIP